MKAKKTYFYIFIFLIILTMGISFFEKVNSPVENNVLPIIATPVVPESVKNEMADYVKVANTFSTSSIESKEIGLNDFAREKAELIIQENKYDLPVGPDISLYDAMVSLNFKKSLTFKADYHPGLGYFIKEINRQKNKDGFYWTLYINGVYSNVGAADYFLSANDKIEWRFEKK